MTVAWDNDARGFIVDYGTVQTWDEVKAVISTEYDGPGGEIFRPMMTLIDAKDGNRQDEVIEFCRGVNKDRGPYVWPSEGAKAGSMGLVPYRRTVLDSQNRRKGNPRVESSAFCIVKVNTNYFQQWIHNCLYSRDQSDSQCLLFPKQAKRDEELFAQLMNELPDTRRDATNHESFLWVVVFESVPVDFRDCARYNRCAAEVYTKSRWARVPKKPRVVKSDGAGDHRQKTKPKKQKSRRPRRPSADVSRSWIRKLANKRFG
jgi:hypothetical protein